MNVISWLRAKEEGNETTGSVSQTFGSRVFGLESKEVEIRKISMGPCD